MSNEGVRFVARYASQTVSGDTFVEVADLLTQRGFDIARAVSHSHGSLTVPHTDGRRRPANLFRTVRRVVPKSDLPMQPEVLAAVMAGKRVAEGGDGPGLKTRPCGSVHPDGAVCVVSVYAETRCCSERVYAHEGPHEARTPDGVVTNRWVETLEVEDLPFDAYAPEQADVE